MNDEMNVRCDDMKNKTPYRYYFETACGSVAIALITVVAYHQSQIGNPTEYRNWTLIQAEVILLMLTMALFVAQCFRIIFPKNRQAWRAAAISAPGLGGTVLWAFWYDMSTLVYAT